MGRGCRANMGAMGAPPVETGSKASKHKSTRRGPSHTRQSVLGTVGGGDSRAVARGPWAGPAATSDPPPYRALRGSALDAFFSPDH